MMYKKIFALVCTILLAPSFCASADGARYLEKHGFQPIERSKRSNDTEMSLLPAADVDDDEATLLVAATTEDLPPVDLQFYEGVPRSQPASPSDVSMIERRPPKSYTPINISHLAAFTIGVGASAFTCFASLPISTHCDTSGATVTCMTTVENLNVINALWISGFLLGPGLAIASIPYILKKRTQNTEPYQP